MDSANIESDSINKLTRLIMITGGARSGKSSFAEQLAYKLNPVSTPIGYLATAEACDPEFAARISMHQATRGNNFITREEPRNIGRAVSEMRSSGIPVVLMECVSTWLGNLFWRHWPQDTTLENSRLAGQLCADIARTGIADLLAALNAPAVSDELDKKPFTLIIVSNELGLGLVPPDAQSRWYRDAHGWVNQKIAAAADEVWLTVSGIPLRIK